MKSTKTCFSTLAQGVFALLLNTAFVSIGLALPIADGGGDGEGPAKKPVTGEIRSVKITATQMLFPGTPFSIVVGGITPTNGKRCDILYEIKSAASQDRDSGAFGANVGMFPFSSGKTWKFEALGTHTIKVWSANADCKGQAELALEVFSPPPFPKLKLGL